MEVVELTARTDYRREKLQGQKSWYAPPDEKAAAALSGAFEALSGVERGKPMVLRVLGRALAVPEAHAHVGRFSFADLCEAPLGPSDYLYIARYFHTLIVDDIPVIAAERRDVAARFITLIDALYEEHVKLIASAEAEPAGLYLGVEGQSGVPVRPHRLAPHRDALGSLYGPAAWLGRLAGAAATRADWSKPEGCAKRSYCEVWTAGLMQAPKI